ADAALALGAERVDVVSASAPVLSVAERIGAKPIEAGADGKLGPYPITVDASGDPAGLRLAIRSTDLAGVCTSPVWYPGEEAPVGARPLQRGGMCPRGLGPHAGGCPARPLLAAVADAVAGGRPHPDIIATRRIPWREAVDAMADPAVKLVIDREPS